MSAQTIYTQASLPISASGNSVPLLVGNFAELALDINITAKSGTSPTIQFFIDRLGLDSVYYNVYTSSQFSTTPQIASQSIGAGLVLAASFAGTIQFRWLLGGTSPVWTYSVSLIGK